MKKKKFISLYYVNEYEIFICFILDYKIRARVLYHIYKNADKRDHIIDIRPFLSHFIYNNLTAYYLLYF